MSTTIKRIALVAVAALSLGVVSTVPSQATVSANSLTLSSATSTQLTSETSTATAAVATLSFLNTNVADTVSVTAYLMSAPAGNTKTPVLQVSETTSAVVGSSTPISALAAGSEITGQVAYVAGTASTAAVTAKFKVYMNSATVAGAYVIKLVPAVVAGGGVIDTTGVTLTITVSANPATDVVATSGSAVLVSTTDTTTATTGTDAVVTGDKTATAVGTSGAVEVAYIKTALLNAAGLATTGESYTALVTSGPGVLSSNALGSSYTDGTNFGRAISVKAGDAVAIYPDGASGVSTIQIQTKLGVVIATKTLTFYGDVASISASLVKKVIAPSGQAQDAVLVTLKDAAGTSVSKNTTFYVSSSDTTKVSGAYTSQAGTWAAKNYIDGVNVGSGYLLKLTGVAAGSANITIGTKSSAAATTGVDATALAVRVGAAAATATAKVTVTTDKSSYAPGEKATITVSVFDKDGLAVADGNVNNVFATGGISASYSLTGDTLTAVNYSGAYGIVDGVFEYTVYMPVTEGDVKLSWTTGAGLSVVANQGVAGSLTVSVGSASTNAAIDAANEAAQAASDATDAALAAADAADAATTKAQEAVDAVATLSAQVSKLITALKAQITTLTNLVIKIQKKVKA